MLTAAVERAAVFRVEAHPGWRRIATLPAACRPPTEDEGYAIQARAHARLSAAGWESIRGLKIGCTTAVMQSHLGIGEPCAGGVFGAGTHAGGAAFRHAAYHQVGAEFEIAAELGAGLPPRPRAGRPCRPGSSSRSAASCAPATRGPATSSPARSKASPRSRRGTRELAGPRGLIAPGGSSMQGAAERPLVPIV